MSCEICPIINNPDPDEVSLRLAEGDFWRATLRANDQSLLGATFITLKRHAGSLPELSWEEWLEFADMNSRVETAIRRSLGAASINTSFLMNHAFRDANPEPHIHCHLKPRYAEPVEFDGETFSDPSFGSYLDGHHERQPVSMKTGQKIADAIKLEMAQHNETNTTKK